MAPKPEVKVIQLQSQDELDKALRELAQIEARLKTKTGSFDKKVAGLREKLDTDIKADLERKQLLDKQVREYCPKNRTTIFGDRNVLQHRYATLRISDGSPALAPVEGQDEQGCIKLIKKVFRAAASTYIDTKESLIKNALKTLPEDKLAKVGLCIVKTPKFDYDIKTEAAEPARKAA